MIEHAPEQPAADIRDPLSRQAFLNSHRAVAVCTREFSRLADDLINVVKAFAAERELEAPTVRKAPDRCIVQLGPVALTVAWLRNGSDSPANGELLAMVWHGVVAPPNDHSPERASLRAAPRVPVTVWEETLVASATSEASWHWHPEDLTREGYASPELAARCLGQLSQALESVAKAA